MVKSSNKQSELYIDKTTFSR